MNEHMNPFWFVPTDGKRSPRLSLEQWGVWDSATRSRSSGPHLLSGRIVLKLKALTPIHITGEAQLSGQALARRAAYRRRNAAGADVPVVEGASIRGMLRAYVEALTNGIASVHEFGFEGSKLVGGPGGAHTSDGGGVYQKRSGEQHPNQGRHIGFWVGPTPPEGTEGRGHFESKQAGRRLHGTGMDVQQVHANDGLIPGADLGMRKGSDLSDVRVDAATLLFGFVTRAWRRGSKESQGEDGAPAPVVAIRGRIAVDDVYFKAGDVHEESSIDLNGAAYFGGPKPSKSSWWYFKPGKVAIRKTRFRGQVRDVVEFVGGDQLLGRKFYFHQRPRNCVDWYLTNWSHQRPVRVRTECIKTGAVSDLFEIVFEDLPRPVLELLLVALCPSHNVRHKVGALKPLGFGSIEFKVEDVLLAPTALDGLDFTQHERSDATLVALANSTGVAEQREFCCRIETAAGGLTELVDRRSWERLRLICHWVASEERLGRRLFVYPPYRQGQGLTTQQRGFAVPIGPRDLPPNTRLPATGPAAEQIVKKLFGDKKDPIWLDHYQQSAASFAAVKQDAGLS